MKTSRVAVLFALCVVTACVVTPGPPGSGSITVTPLPAVVELGPEPYYYQQGYYYFYQNNSWRYSQSRRGPWTDLPRSYWPKEIRYRDRGRDQDSDRRREYDRDRQQDYDRDRDYRRNYDR